MDFSFSEEQAALRDLAAQIFADMADDRTRASRSNGAPTTASIERTLWPRSPRRNCWVSPSPKSSAAWVSRMLELTLRARAARPLRRARSAPADAGARRAADRRVRLAPRSKNEWLPAVAQGDVVLTARVRRTRREQRAPIFGAGNAGRRRMDACRAPRSRCRPRTLPTPCSCLPTPTTGSPCSSSIRGRPASGSRDTRRRRATCSARCTFAGRVVSDDDVLGAVGQGGTDRRVDGRPRRHRRRGDRARMLRAGVGAHRGVHVRARAVRATAVDQPRCGDPRRRCLHRHRLHAGHDVAGRVAARTKVCPRAKRSTSPSTGRPKAGSASCTRRSTCTAGWAPTSTIPCTATSSG